MNFKTFFESKERQYNIEILNGPYTNEDARYRDYNEDVLYDVTIDGIKMTWNDTRKWCQANFSTPNAMPENWKKNLGINDENIVDVFDIIDDQIEKAIKVRNIMKHGASKKEAKVINTI